MTRTARTLPTPALALLALVLLAPAARAVPRPTLSTSLHRSYGILGQAKQGGTAFQLAALWPARESWSVGFGIWGADAGGGTERLLDPVTGQDLGPVAGPTTYALGGGWALDVHPWAAGGDSTNAPGWLRGAFVTGNAGMYDVKVADTGRDVFVRDSFGFGLGLGWRFALGDRHQLGPALRYTRVFNDALGRYFSAGLEWTWR